VQEAPVQPPPPAMAKAKKAASFRGASTIRCQERREADGGGRRSGLTSCMLAALAASFSPLAADRPARDAVLEEDDDIDLLKKDRSCYLKRRMLAGRCRLTSQIHGRR
jgi:hypothetical protein